MGRLMGGWTSTEKSREYNRSWRNENAERDRANKQAWRDRNPDYSRTYLLKTLYGLSLDDYQTMLDRQDGACALCLKKPGQRNLSVDHDHETGRVRGLLCQKCNRMLGGFEGSVEVLGRTVAYMQAIVADRESSAGNEAVA